MPQAIVTESPTSIDITILNTLRCEPPSFAFDFFDYAGLPRSVFHLLQDIPDLENRIQANSGKNISIPSSSTSGIREHSISYERYNGIFFVLANAYNNFSKQSDAKLLASSKIRGLDGKTYDATFLALEVYREKGDRHPIWEVGFYITAKGSKKILYEESVIIYMPESSARSSLIAPLVKFIQSINGLPYNPSTQGITHNPNKFIYLSSLIQNTPHIGIIDEAEFAENRAKWFRYLVGTLDVEKVFKFEDRSDPQNIKKYRVELISTHLIPNVKGGYITEVFEDTKKKQKGPFGHRDALAVFYEQGNHYLDLLYQRAGKGKRQFDISLNPQQNDFRFATIVMDIEHLPITISSWKTPYRLDGRKLPQGMLHYYLLLWDHSPNPLRLDEGINFDGHPRHFMGRLLKAMPSIEYRGGSTFIEQARQYGVPLRTR